ncbi:MAG: mycothiol conjugate amidase Mca [Bowdeniella nasicola]|nr:mycothiol conjugate amidase Mca [Bowdeniella nasicola]
MRLLAVHAHPDDEASKGAGTLAKYAAEGHQVRVLTCTGGERGDVLNPRLKDDQFIVDNLIKVRKSEMASAVHALGISHRWLGFVDSGLPSGDPLPPLPEGCFALQGEEVVLPAMVAELREFRPHVVTTYNEQGGYPHPDHIQTHKMTMAALAPAADPTYRTDLGEPWQVQKVYYDVSFAKPRIAALHEEMLRRGIDSGLAQWLQTRPDRALRRVDARIDVHEYFPQRDGALRAHATQIDPDGFFFMVPRELEAEVWPWEEFELAYTAPGVQRRDGEMEDCLFAGIPR